ncbi:MAG: hypothetical protein MUO31_05500 [Thermodesulfovibrionales bacterium]|nr:hypothetical protein [Thermodesulfovibrionales bacterium]
MRKLPQHVPFTLYIDGPILMFSGNVKNVLQNSCMEQNCRNVCMLATKKYDCIVNQCKRVCQLSRVVVAFDGDAPAMKCSTQQLRRLNFRFNVDMRDVRQMLSKSLKSQNRSIPAEILNLNRGEAEFYIYQSRDTSTSSLLYTKDTDLYAIAYAHVQQTPVDNVFFYTGPSDKPCMYDMSKFRSDSVDKTTFRLLMSLSGTDFNSHIFTKSMILPLCFALFWDETSLQNAIGIENAQNIIIASKQLKLYSADLRQTIAILLDLIDLTSKYGLGLKLNKSISQKCPRKATRPRQSKIVGYNPNDTISKLQWVIDYYENGAAYSGFADGSLADHTIDSFSFISWCRDYE